MITQPESDGRGGPLGRSERRDHVRGDRGSEGGALRVLVDEVAPSIVDITFDLGEHVNAFHIDYNLGEGDFIPAGSLRRRAAPDVPWPCRGARGVLPIQAEPSRASSSSPLRHGRLHGGTAVGELLAPYHFASSAAGFTSVRLLQPVHWRRLLPHGGPGWGCTGGSGNGCKGRCGAGCGGSGWSARTRRTARATTTGRELRDGFGRLHVRWQQLLSPTATHRRPDTGGGNSLRIARARTRANPRRFSPLQVRGSRALSSSRPRPMPQSHREDWPRPGAHRRSRASRRGRCRLRRTWPRCLS